jgi:hypothetical protein
MDRDRLETAIMQLDQAETCVFRLVESEPDLIRHPEILEVLTHLKHAHNSLQELGRSRLQVGNARRVGGQEA